MEYASPELVEVGRAEVLVLGIDGGMEDHVGSTETRPPMGLVLGLDE